MRYPAVAGRFYPLQRDELYEQIEWCFEHPLGPGRIGSRRNDRRIKGALVPHAGYQCSGMNAAHAFKAIAEDGKPDAYVIIGPDHHGVPFDAVLCSDSYLTPLGECRVHEKIAAKLAQSVTDSPNAHRFEHSVEVEVPFLQYIDPDARIVPIVMRRQDMDSAVRLGKRIREACEGYDVVVIASSDMSHYIPKEAAEKLDMMLLDRAVALDIPGMYDAIMRYDISACGYGPIAAMITATQPSKGELLKHSDSWDSLSYMKDSVVGYASAIFR